MAKHSTESIVARHLKQAQGAMSHPETNAAIHLELTKALVEDLSSPSLDSLLLAAGRLEQLSLVAGVKGVAGVCKGKPEGWNALYESYSYLSWNVRVYTGLYQRGRISTGFDFSFPQNRALCSLAHAIAIQDDEFAEWCGQMLLSNYQIGDGPFNRWYCPFGSFLIELFARWKSLKIATTPLPRPPLGVFQELLEAWNHDRDFASALIKACDYHVERSVDGKIAHAEFVRIPYNVFPVDILAIKRIRDEAGLSWPTVQHPLLNTPMVTPPRTSRNPNELFVHVETAVRSLMPAVCPTRS